jgi:hypothetical protein
MDYIFQKTSQPGTLTLAVLSSGHSRPLWKAEWPSFTEDPTSGRLMEDPTLVDLGIMKDTDDVEGLANYLRAQGILQTGDYLIGQTESYSYALGGEIDSAFEPFARIVRESKSVAEAFEKVKQDHSIPSGVAERFRKTYDPNGDLTPQQAFNGFYLQVKAASTHNGFEGSPLQVYDRVRFTRDNQEYDPHNPYGSTRFQKGKLGHIMLIEKDADGNFFYTVQGTGLIPTQHVPADALELADKEVKEKVEKRLSEAQKSKEFKDVGKRVAGSKKEKRAFSIITMNDLSEIEEDEVTAFQLVTKDKVYPELNVLEQREQGVSSGAVFLKMKLREACGTKPPNHREKRMSFIKFIGFVCEQTAPMKTVREVLNFLSSIKDWKADQIIGYFMDSKFLELSEAEKQTLREKFQQKFGRYSEWSIIKKLLEEVFGKRFANFIYMDSESAAVEVRDQARAYEHITAEESEELVAAYRERTQRFIDANQKSVDEYSAYSDEQLKGKFSGWSGMDRFRRDMPGFRAAAIQYFQKKVNTGKASLEVIPDNIKEREDDWSWFEQKKEKKEVASSGEIQINSGIPLTYIKRTGGIKITEQLVEAAQSTDMSHNPIIVDFGFKSVQFGNAIKNVEAREHIRHFLGAMSDLAEILDINLKDLNRIGGLSIAFAARGSGRAMAHYESGRCIINLTNSQGDGTVAHEFGHYFDNALTIWGRNKTSMDWGSEIKKVKERWTYREKLESFIQSEAVSEAMYQIVDFFQRGKKGVTPEVKQFFVAKGETLSKPPRFYNEVTREFQEPEILGTIEETFALLRTQTSIVRDLNYRYPDLQVKVIGYVIARFDKMYYELDFPVEKSAYLYYSEKMSSKYWTKVIELFARAWETYVWDKLEKAGRMNNYLVSSDMFNLKIPVKGGGYTYVYPFGAERDHLFTLYDNLVETVKREYNLAGFVPFSKNREDEYLVLPADDKPAKGKDSETPVTEVVVPLKKEEPVKTGGNHIASEYPFGFKNKLGQLVDKEGFEGIETAFLQKTADEVKGGYSDVDSSFRSASAAAHSMWVEQGIHNGYYQKMVESGRMPAQRAADIIQSIGANVPGAILDRVPKKPEHAANPDGFTYPDGRPVPEFVFSVIESDSLWLTRGEVEKENEDSGEEFRESALKNHTHWVLEGITNGYYVRQVESGRMTEKVARAVIESEGFRVPDAILAKFPKEPKISDHYLDRKGELKKDFMLTREEYLQRLRDSNNYPQMDSLWERVRTGDYIQEVKEALEFHRVTNQYHQWGERSEMQEAIKEGRLTVEDALKVIKSAGLDVPEYITKMEAKVEATPASKEFTFYKDKPMLRGKALPILEKLIRSNGQVMTLAKWIEGFEKGLEVDRHTKIASRNDKGYVEKISVGDHIMGSATEADYYEYLQGGGYPYTAYLEDEKVKKEAEDKRKSEAYKMENEKKQSAHQKMEQDRKIYVLTHSLEEVRKNYLGAVYAAIADLERKRKTAENLEELAREKGNLSNKEKNVEGLYKTYHEVYFLDENGIPQDRFSYQVGDKVRVDDRGEWKEATIVSSRQNVDKTFAYKLEGAPFINPYFGYTNLRPLVINQPEAVIPTSNENQTVDKRDVGQEVSKTEEEKKYQEMVQGYKNKAQEQLIFSLTHSLQEVKQKYLAAQYALVLELEQKEKTAANLKALDFQKQILLAEEKRLEDSYSKDHELYALDENGIPKEKFSYQIGDRVRAQDRGVWKEATIKEISKNGVGDVIYRLSGIPYNPSFHYFELRPLAGVQPEKQTVVKRDVGQDVPEAEDITFSGYYGSGVLHTPVLDAVLAVKRAHPGSIVLVHVGGFYEAYGQDAELMNREYGSALKVSKGGLKITGGPAHSLPSIVKAMTGAGKTVATWKPDTEALEIEAYKTILGEGQVEHIEAVPQTTKSLSQEDAGALIRKVKYMVLKNVTDQEALITQVAGAGGGLPSDIAATVLKNKRVSEKQAYWIAKYAVDHHLVDGEGNLSAVSTQSALPAETTKNAAGFEASDDHGIEVGKTYPHNFYGKVKVLSVERNTEGDKQDEISHSVLFETPDGTREEQGINGFRHDSTGDYNGRPVAIEDGAVAKAEPLQIFVPREYLLTQRPPSIGTHPVEGLLSVIETEFNNRNAWLLTYSHELSEEEIKRFELKRILNAKDLKGRTVHSRMGIDFTVSDVEEGVITLTTVVNGKEKQEKLSAGKLYEDLKSGRFRFALEAAPVEKDHDSKHTSFDYNRLLTPNVVKSVMGSVRAAKYEGNDSVYIDTDKIISSFSDKLSPEEYKQLNWEKADDFLLAYATKVFDEQSGQQDPEAKYKVNTESGKELDVRRPITHEDYNGITSQDHLKVASKHRELEKEVSDASMKGYHAGSAHAHEKAAKGQASIKSQPSETKNSNQWGSEELRFNNTREVRDYMRSHDLDKYSPLSYKGLVDKDGMEYQWINDAEWKNAPLGTFVPMVYHLVKKKEATPAAEEEKFPTDQEILEMGKHDFIQHYLKASYKKEFGTLEGFEAWKERKDSNYQSCANNAVDVYDLVVEKNEEMDEEVARLRHEITYSKSGKRLPKRNERAIRQDLFHQALPPGKHTSESGHIYYEYRPEHTDQDPTKKY